MTLEECFIVWTPLSLFTSVPEGGTIESSAGTSSFQVIKLGSAGSPEIFESRNWGGIAIIGY
jgi:hypothetical protein